MKTVIATKMAGICGQGLLRNEWLSLWPCLRPYHLVQYTDDVGAQTLTKPPTITPRMLVMIISQGTSPAETLRTGRRDHDYHHIARYHPITPPLAFQSTKTEAVDTSSERRRTDPALVNTSHDCIAPAPTSDHWRNLYEVSKAGITNRSPRVKNKACIVMVLNPVTDRREHLHKPQK